MPWKRCLAFSCLLAGCAAYDLRPAQPPRDLAERRRAEDAACWAGTLPAWLDEDALASAARLDRSEARAGRWNDSFRGPSYTDQPPPTPAPTQGSRVDALWEQRRELQRRCSLLRWDVKRRGGPPKP